MATISNGLYSMRDLTRTTMLFSDKKRLSNVFLLNGAKEGQEQQEGSSWDAPQLLYTDQHDLQSRYKQCAGDRQKLIAFLQNNPAAIVLLLKDDSASLDKKDILENLSLNSKQWDTAYQVIQKDGKITRDMVALFHTTFNKGLGTVIEELHADLSGPGI